LVAKRKKANAVIMLALHAIWLERNARIFEEKSVPMVLVLNAILNEWRSWLACRGRHREEIT
jgi:phosphoribosylpyrophosphate synthetase